MPAERVIAPSLSSNENQERTVGRVMHFNGSDMNRNELEQTGTKWNQLERDLLFSRDMIVSK